MSDETKPSAKYVAISTGIGADKVALTPGSEGADPAQLGWNGSIKGSEGIGVVSYGPYFSSAPLSGPPFPSVSQQKTTPKKKAILGELKHAYAAPLAGLSPDVLLPLDVLAGDEAALSFPYLGSPSPEPLPYYPPGTVVKVLDGQIVSGDAYTPDPPSPVVTAKNADYLDDMIYGRRQVDALEL